MDVEKTIKDMIARLERLEQLFDKKNRGNAAGLSATSNKIITLPELARKANLKNGQLKITAVVGYNEKILEKPPINTARIKELWRDGKFSGSYAFILVHRAVQEGLIRENKSSKEAAYDLSQSGEDLFKKILRSKDDG
jgi:hypothetical protein